MFKYYNFQIVIEPEENGNGYYAYSPNLPGCYSNGKTVEETRRNMREAIQLHLQSILNEKKSVPDLEKKIFVEELSIGVPA